MSEMKGNYASVNGLNMYYEIHGAGKPLVLIHGGGSTIETSFGRVLPLFAATHQVIAVELQAHGHTEDRDAPLSFEQDADDVAELLKQLGISKADFIGFSNGGTTLLQIAIRHAGLAGKIVVASALYKKDGAYSWLWESMKNPNFDNMPYDLKEGYLRCNGSTDGLMNMYERDVARMQQFSDIPDAAIGSIKAATLVLAADTDVVTPEHAVELYRQIPGAKLLILPGSHGAYFGEVTTVTSPHEQTYPAMQVIEEFLSGEQQQCN